MVRLPKLNLEANRIQNFFGKTEAYLSDRLAFRQDFLRFGSIIENGLGIRKYSKNVIIGQDGWLFYRPSYNASMVENLNGIPDTQTIEGWENYFGEIKGYLDSLDIDFIIMIVPDKHSVYPEYLPTYYQNQKKTLLDRFTAQSKNPLLSLQLPFQQTKKTSNTPLFYKTDTHWNLFGAYLAYENIMARLPVFYDLNHVILQEGDFKEKSFNSVFDLIKQLNAYDYYEDVEISLDHGKVGNGSFLEEFPHAPEQEAIVKNIGVGSNIFDSPNVTNDSKEGTLLVFGDSFVGNLSPYLNATFHTIVYRHYTKGSSLTIEELVELYNPDFVLFEMVERKLADLNTKLIRLNKSPKLRLVHAIDLNEIKTPCPEDTKIVLRGASKDSLYITALNEDPMLALPEYVFRAGDVLEIDITSELETSLQVYYETKNNPGFNETNSIKHALNIGRQTVQIQMHKITTYRSLRLDPGCIRGNYIIHQLRVLKK